MLSAGEEGVAALAAAARLNPNMTKLSIKGIKAPNARLKELHAACTANAECIARQASLHAEGPMGSAFARAQHGHMPLHTASTKHSPRPAFGRVSAPAEHAQTGKQTHQAGGKHRPHSSSRLTVTPRLWSGTALPACTSADNTSPTGCMDPTQMAAARLEGKRASGTQASAAGPGSVPAAPYPLPCTHSSGLMLGQQQYSSLQSVVRLLAQPALAVEHAVADIISRALMEDCAVAAQLQPSAMAAEGPGSNPELDGLGHALAASHAAMEGQWRVECTVSTGGGAGNECLRNLRHTFLRVSMGAEQHVHHAGIDGDSSSGTADAASYHAPWPGSHMVIDPRFAEQFEVSNPTLRYEAVLAWLPRVFVGCAERLPLLVAVLCNEMEQCFKARGIALPPWREPGALITKWMPKPHLSAGHTSQSAAAGTLQ